MYIVTDWNLAWVDRFPNFLSLILEWPELEWPVFHHMSILFLLWTIVRSSSYSSILGLPVHRTYTSPSYLPSPALHPGGARNQQLRKGKTIEQIYQPLRSISVDTGVDKHQKKTCMMTLLVSIVTMQLRTICYHDPRLLFAYSPTWASVEAIPSFGGHTCVMWVLLAGISRIANIRKQRSSILRFCVYSLGHMLFLQAITYIVFNMTQMYIFMNANSNHIL